MPKIRSITAFDNITPATHETVVAQTGAFLQKAKAAFAPHIEVQTTRLATQPFTQGFAPNGPGSVAGQAARVFAGCTAQEIEYLSIGPVGLADNPAYIPVIVDVFRQTPGVFATVSIADLEHGIIPTRLDKTAQLISDVSTITPDGMTNLYLAALANCAPGSPFFPVAYHDGGEPAFALAMQSADLAVQAVRESETATAARENLTKRINSTAALLVPIAEQLASESGMRFLGLDFSLAPFPTDEESLGGALELFGQQFGAHGLVGAASMVMNAIELAEFPRVGFSGLMLPILEDSVLGRRVSEGRLQLNDLLLLSAVCGTGLDCVPLPGDIPSPTLRDMLLDVAALALRLDKPLTARLMPFPGKQAGDPLTFDFPFFADASVLAEPHRTGNSRWKGDVSIPIHARR
jgi:uncharacterized protein